MAVDAVVRERAEARDSERKWMAERQREVERAEQARTESLRFCDELYPDKGSRHYQLCNKFATDGIRSTYERAELKAAVEGFLKEEKADRDRAARAAAEVTRRRDARNRELAQVPIGMAVERWWLGGFENVFLARVTIQNNADRRLSDFTIACETFGRSGTSLGAVSGVLYESLGPKQRRTYEVNLGSAHPQSASANRRVAAGK